MRRFQIKVRTSLVTVLLAGLTVGGLIPAKAVNAASGSSLVISQLKITSSSGQFITLYNATDMALDMSHYQLEYFNNYDLTKATSSRLIALSGTLPPHGYYMVNDSALLLCYQQTVDSVSLGLSSTAGMIEVLGFDQAMPGGSVVPTLLDYVSWSKTAAVGAQTLPSNTSAWLLRQPVDARNNPVVTMPGVGSWLTVQSDPANACNMVSVVNGAPSGSILTGLSLLAPTSSPPATVISVDDSTALPSPGVLPAGDIGLQAPQITEILPNPSGTGNDSSDEFIELYNANAAPFDLTGFSLVAGTTSLHTYVFPAGSALPAKSFTAFYSKATGLSLSNSGGQVKLLDPLSNSLSATAAYGTAKDGQAWALANGNWYWTTHLTPGAANVIDKPISTNKTNSKAKKTSKPSAGSAAKVSKASSSGNGFATTSNIASSPLHPWVLALVAGVALLYAAYEYRADLANHIHELRRNIAAWRVVGPTLTRWRGHRNGE